jgi:hypothetical protein
MMGIRLLSFLITAMAVSTRSTAAEEDPELEEQEQQIAAQPQAGASNSTSTATSNGGMKELQPQVADLSREECSLRLSRCL